MHSIVQTKTCSIVLNEITRIETWFIPGTESLEGLSRACSQTIIITTIIWECQEWLLGSWLKSETKLQCQFTSPTSLPDLNKESFLFSKLTNKKLPFTWLEFFCIIRASLVAQLVKNLAAMQETWVQSLGWKDPWRRKQLPTPVFWPGEFHRLYSPGGPKSRTWLSNFHFHFPHVSKPSELFPKAWSDVRNFLSKIPALLLTSLQFSKGRFPPETLWVSSQLEGWANLIPFREKYFLFPLLLPCFHPRSNFFLRWLSAGTSIPFKANIPARNYSKI